MTRIVTYWQRMTRPNPSLSAGERRNARMLSSLLLAFLGVVIILQILYIIVGWLSGAGSAWVLEKISGGGALVVLGGAIYLVSRSRYYRSAIWLLSVAFSLAVIGNALISGSMFDLYFLVIVILFSTLLDSVRASIAVTLAMLGVTLAVGLFLPETEISEVTDALLFVVFSGLLLILITNERRKSGAGETKRISRSSSGPPPRIGRAGAG
ncbi:MAG: hypothetical protein GY759_04810 [Chloroflexi bacterium]|nr:hypothetical protein [Chloroflexota bacterium]